jgi:release factor glutamine methyltransferase
MTILDLVPANPVVAQSGVYPPQEDSWLLIEALRTSAVADGRRIADLGTGSGVVAIAAAVMGAREVVAFDISPDAVACAERNARAAGVRVDVRHGSWTLARDCAPFDVVVANPPYVPIGPHWGGPTKANIAAPVNAWAAGPDGRAIIDPICDSAAELLSNRGTLLMVQSGFADVPQSLRRLRATGLVADVVATESIEFGPVLSACAEWLDHIGKLSAGQRHEELVVIRADKP